MIKMGTPIKNLIKIPRLLSPRSPKFLNVLNPELIHNRERIKQVKLSDSGITPVKIRISPASDLLGGDFKRDILITTPNKQKLMENGIENENLFHVLGKGSFGNVFKAVYKDQTTAVKLVKKSHSYCREKNALNFSHKNIVKTLEVIENENKKKTFSLVIMEYLPNSTNLQNIINNFQDEIDFIQYARDISEGLLYCHKNFILHLDIKPSNILVFNNVCKICDFGNSMTVFDRTDSFEHRGTIQYTSPEILLGKKPTEKSDVFSLGVVFWQMKTRKCLYQDIDNVQCIIYKVVKCNLRPDLAEPTDRFSLLYQQCWSQNPSDRPNVSSILKLLITL